MALAGSPELRLSQVVASLSRALDLTDGHDLGHAARTCRIGMRLAQELGLPEAERAALLYGLLLKDAGCSSNAARVSELYRADDHGLKRNVKTVDHKRAGEALAYLWRNVGGANRVARAVNVVRVGVVGPRLTREMTELRCERGAEIASMLDLPAGVADAIRALDEHWDGNGHPRGLAGQAIPLLGRILCLAQSVEVFAARDGLGAALAMARARSGRWFDPALVDALARTAGDTPFWASLRATDPAEQVALLEPADRILPADDRRLDRVAEAFAVVIDAKSPYTLRHSERVAEIAVAVGAGLGIEGAALRDLRRTALLHDIGKLGVSNLILDKQARLTADEWEAMRRHTAYTADILRRSGAFASIADTAAAHHERLDGTGYHLGLGAYALGPAARALAVADVYEALTVDRPYRAALAPEQALALIHEDVPARLCPRAVAALERSLGEDALAAAA